MIPTILRPYQQEAVDAALDAVRAGARLLIASPTGSGKSYIEGEVFARCLADGLRPVLISPRLEILEGIARKMGVALPVAQTAREKALEAADLLTPMRLKNRLITGAKEPYDVVIIDECHHATADTYVLLDAMHGGSASSVPRIGFTATPFRGSPKETRELKERWGEPFVALTWKEAVEERVVTMPACEIVPLLDDDVVTIQGADFRVSGVGGLEQALTSRLGELARLVEHVWQTDERPLMVALPSTALVGALAEALDALNVPRIEVTQATSSLERSLAFADCIGRKAALLQIDVVSEGVDLPIRILIDAKPTLSPVRWQQQVGRITRPADESPRYICINRNLERHGYLFEGLLPRGVVAAAQKEWGGATKRSGARHIGLEALGRYKPISIPLLDGAVGSAFNIYNWDNTSGQRREYFVFVLPGGSAPLCASRTNGARPDGSMDWGKWAVCTLPADFAGFQTSAAKWPVSEKQAAWWRRDAKRLGLDPLAQVDGRTFAVLPVLSHLGVRIS
jgi:DNA repair protein RadD